MEKSMIKNAEEYVNSVTKIQNLDEASRYNEDVILLPNDIYLGVEPNCNVTMSCNGNRISKKAKDILRVIKISDALNLKYEDTNVISPSEYVHSLENIPWHITTQGLLITRLDAAIKEYIATEDIRTQGHYNKHPLDKFWLPCSKPLQDVSANELVCVFNRRVSGWDGSIDRPVIELLGAGGHLQCVWNEEEHKFISRSFKDNLKKEFQEEIGLNIKDEDFTIVGGFANNKTHEMVVFACIYVNPQKLQSIQEYAFDNCEEDTDGIYLGTFKETMEYYRNHPDYFAGGSKAAETNFPNNKELMDKVNELFG